MVEEGLVEVQDPAQSIPPLVVDEVEVDAAVLLPEVQQALHLQEVGAELAQVVARHGAPGRSRQYLQQTRARNSHATTRRSHL